MVEPSINSHYSHMWIEGKPWHKTLYCHLYCVVRNATFSLTSAACNFCVACRLTAALVAAWVVQLHDIVVCVALVFAQKFLCSVGKHDLRAGAAQIHNTLLQRKAARGRSCLPTLHNNFCADTNATHHYNVMYYTTRGATSAVVRRHATQKLHTAEVSEYVAFHTTQHTWQYSVLWQGLPSIHIHVWVVWIYRRFNGSTMTMANYWRFDILVAA